MPYLTFIMLQCLLINFPFHFPLAQLGSICTTFAWLGMHSSMFHYANVQHGVLPPNHYDYDSEFLPGRGALQCGGVLSVGLCVGCLLMGSVLAYASTIYRVLFNWNPHYCFIGSL